MKSIVLYISLFLILGFWSCDKRMTGFDVVSEMKTKYNNSWYKNFTFSQKVNRYKNDTIFYKGVWHEAYSFPNRLLIKYDSINSGDGLLFCNDTMYVFKNNVVSFKSRRIHDLIVLGLDIYENPEEVTYSKLKELGYDLSKMCETEIEGKMAYCVGVNKPDEENNKFFIDKESLVFLKSIKYRKGDVYETIFSDYKMIDNKYVATKVLFYKNNKLTMDEEYFDIRFPEDINPEIYNPLKFGEFHSLK